LSETIGYGSAIGIVAAVAYSIVVMAVLMLPETKGKSFTVPEFSSALNGPEKLGRAQGSAV